MCMALTLQEQTESDFRQSKYHITDDELVEVEVIV